MKPWMKPLLATLIIFGTGLVTGSILSGTLADQRKSKPEAKPPVPDNPQQRQPSSQRPRPKRQNSSIGYVHRLNQELQLTDEQSKRIHKTIKSSGTRLHNVLQAVRPRIYEEMKRTNQEIRELLTKEQKVQFDKLKLHRFGRGRPPHNKGKQHPKKPQPEAKQPTEKPMQISSPRNV